MNSRFRHRNLIVALLVLLLTSVTDGRAQAPPSTGQKIGTIIKDAVSTAFPAVKDILAVIWPSGDASKKKSDAADALAAKETDLKKQSADRAKAAVKPLGALSAELSIVEKFGKAATKATPSVITMQTLLSAQPAPADLLKRLKEEWGIASGFLTPLATVTDADIQKVVEVSVRSQLEALRDANKNLVVRINNRVTGSDIKENKDVDVGSLREYLSTLADLLNGINATANVELDMLQQEIAGVLAWANNQQGTSSSTTDAALVKTGKDAVARAKTLLAKSTK